MMGNAKMVSASTLAGDKVVNLSGEDLGEIEDVTIDLDSGRVVYCVLKFGGKLGLGGKLFAIPWQALTRDPQKDCFLLDVKKDMLQNAPGFDRSRWPDMSDPRWGAGVHTHYGVTPYWHRPH